MTLCIGENKITFPECVKNIFGNGQIHLNHIAASWYHDSELLPYYIHININGYQVFFNLGTLEIFQIWRPEIIVSENQGNEYKFNEQEIFNECQIEISDSIEKR